MLFFVLISTIYVLSLAVVDGLFNRLVFRADRKLPYGSSGKRKIYHLPEWKYIGVIFLVVLPLIIPLAVSWMIGGLKYVLVYLAIFSLVQWDMIFGKLVFDSWFGDTPSIDLPKIGWISISIYKSILTRLAIFVFLLMTLWFLR